MKKVLKNILKWLILVFICFSVVFTVLSTLDQGGIIEAIEYQIENRGESIIYKMQSSELQEYCKYWQETADKSFANNSDMYEYLNEEHIDRELELKKLYKNYPVGVTMLAQMLNMSESMSRLYILSSIIGVVVGTAIYLLLDKDKKGIVIVIVIYILSVIILGFVYGLMNVAGGNLLDKWMLPSEYIIPVSIVFGLVVIVRFVRQKEIARKLNEKLNQRKEEKTK